MSPSPDNSNDQARQIYGIDFSGARDAGEKIWIARGVSDNERLIIRECFRARDLPNSGKRLEACLPAVVDLIRAARNAAFGIDFPFGLHGSLVKEHTWDEFVLAFPSHFTDPDDFKRKCFANAGNRELRRRTDDEAHTPFSSYNLRLYKQTYYGISEVLLPIVQDKSAWVLPFHNPIDGEPSILEICPASTLKALSLNGTPYKGRDDTRRNNRRKILSAIEQTCPIKIEQAEIRRWIIEDKGGDALDSVIAAAATFNVIRNEDTLIPNDQGSWEVEGYVYF
jgi:hypothetical protein